MKSWYSNGWLLEQCCRQTLTNDQIAVSGVFIGIVLANFKNWLENSVAAALFAPTR